jgi:6-phosphofructo-2-kinase/fructose-2,6-biphosphatase 4
MGFIPGSHLDTVSSGAAHNMRRPRRPSRPELGDVMNDLEERNAQNTFANICRSTAEIAANSPRYRRKSSTFIDGIHDLRNDSQLAPAQLYSTMSGRLFHSGRIAIVLVGLPARGKT